jgi:tetratricopeptide (TPR) repeat protein
MAERAGDESMIGKAHLLLAHACFKVADCARGVEHARDAIARLRVAGDPAWLGYAHFWLASNLAHLGRHLEALRMLASARGLAEEAGDLRFQTSIHCFSGLSHAAAGDFEAAVTACSAAVALAPDPTHRAFALAFLGGVHAEGGQAQAAVATLEQALKEHEHFTGLTGPVAWAHAQLSVAARLAGDVARAEATARKAVELAASIGWKLGHGCAQRALGLALAARGAADEAETHLREAVQTLQSAQAGDQLAATRVALARALLGRGEVVEAASELKAAGAAYRALGLERRAAGVEQVAREWGLAPD